MADCPTPQFRMESFDVTSTSIGWDQPNQGWEVNTAGFIYGQFTCNDEEGETSKCTQGDSKGRCELLPAAKELKVPWNASYIESSMMDEIVKWLDIPNDGWRGRLKEASEELSKDVDTEMSGENSFNWRAVVIIKDVTKKIDDAIWWANEGFPGNMFNGYDYKCLCITERKLATDINLSHYL